MVFPDEEVRAMLDSAYGEAVRPAHAVAIAHHLRI
jgi:hypothetical protein